MNPGSWCEKPLWSWRQTVEVMSRLIEATGAQQALDLAAELAANGQTLSPRTRLVSVPYALQAEAAGRRESVRRMDAALKRLDAERRTVGLDAADDDALFDPSRVSWVGWTVPTRPTAPRPRCDLWL